MIDPFCDVKVGTHVGPYWKDVLGNSLYVCSLHKAQYNESALGPFNWEQMPIWSPVELAFCKSTDELPNGDHWVMEPKLDGFRLQVILDSSGELTTYTRTNHVATGKMPAVETAIRALSKRFAATVLDGEAVFINEAGQADFNFTARIMGSGAAVAAKKQSDAGQYVSFMAFDILWWQGIDLRAHPLRIRRRVLEWVARKFHSDYIMTVPQAPPSLEQHLRYIDEYGEGSVIKDLNAPYTKGRSKAMLKWKKVSTEDVVIMGMKPGNGKYSGQVGAIIFGQYGFPGHRCTNLCEAGWGFHERGRCSGMDDATRMQFTANLPVGQVMEITHNGILAGGGFRHPQFSRLRPPNDKAAKDCTWTKRI